MASKNARSIVENVIEKKASLVKESLNKAMSQRAGEILTERKLELFRVFIHKHRSR